MPGGICIFGYDDNGNGVRPVILDNEGEPRGLSEEYLRGVGPFMQVEFDFIKPQPKAPHVEDWLIDESCQPRVIRTLSEKEIKEFLRRISYDSMESADWGTEIHLYRDKRNKNVPYINPGEGKKSIVTIKVKNILFFEYSTNKQSDKPGKYEYRIAFSDMIGDDLSVTDLAIREYCDNLREKRENCEGIGAELQQKLNQREVFFRIGAGRPFIPKENDGPKCFLFVTGIYSFPDYKN